MYPLSYDITRARLKLSMCVYFKHPFKICTGNIVEDLARQQGRQDLASETPDHLHLLGQVVEVDVLSRLLSRDALGRVVE